MVVAGRGCCKSVRRQERKKFSSPPEFLKLWQNDFTSTPLAGILNCFALFCFSLGWFIQLIHLFYPLHPILPESLFASFTTSPSPRTYTRHNHQNDHTRLATTTTGTSTPQDQIQPPKPSPSLRLPRSRSPRPIPQTRSSPLRCRS